LVPLWHIWGRRGAYRGLVLIPGGKIPLRGSRRGWEDNIKMHLPEVGWTGLLWLRIVTGGRLY